MQIPEPNIRNMLNAISKGNHVFNEKVKLFQNTKEDCPDCEYDPIRKESTDYNCQTCDGTGFIVTEVSQTISSSIELEDDFRYDFSKAGKITKGKIYMTVDILEINTILDPTGKYDFTDYAQMKAFVESYDYIVWAGAKYHIESFEPGWLQGYLYEIGLILSLME